MNSSGELLGRYSKGNSILLYSASKVVHGLLYQPKYLHKVFIESIVVCRGGYRILTRGVETREQAKKYCGLFLGLAVEEAKNKFGGSPEAYLFEYLNLQVFDEVSGENLGSIVHVEEIAGKAVFVVRLKNTQSEIILPAFSDYVTKTDTPRNILYTKHLDELIQD